MPRSFDELVAEAVAAPVDGWEFSWLDGRATEQRPSWGYQRQLARRLSGVGAAVDLHTGGGEVLAGLEKLEQFGGFPPTMAATESWPPNAARATELLHPRGVVVVTVPDRPPLPFGDSAFDLVSSRHPLATWWDEIARVLRPGGRYFAQQIGPATMLELTEFFLGPMPRKGAQYEPEAVRADAVAAGMEIIDLRSERLRAEFFDVGAVIYFLRKVIWTVPDFSVDAHLDRLRQMHELIEAQGPFVAHATRVLVEARKP
ncbi:SAM-dependent methyltransferase [Mycolicibacter kumamotonensis]|jgi:SAM-dependent methyltransferase|uniref:SAM-dependent methyltransferase n=1 Tax=Mycolicibacter kumamotonensis TaxID=354243 RepID=A0A1X0EFL8_9MYCO|nr:methyltransferase domain-containing protein [Mycolicibacter kumamotonensis]ORA83426.1 SAM-dependent methyltransferase [Mycolicibacter kumamotonensis]